MESDPDYCEDIQACLHACMQKLQFFLISYVLFLVLPLGVSGGLSCLGKKYMPLKYLIPGDSFEILFTFEYFYCVL